MKKLPRVGVAGHGSPGLHGAAQPHFTASISKASESISMAMRGATRAREKAASSRLRRPRGPVGRINGSSSNCARRTWRARGRRPGTGLRAERIRNRRSSSNGSTLQRRAPWSRARRCGQNNVAGAVPWLSSRAVALDVRDVRTRNSCAGSTQVLGAPWACSANHRQAGKKWTRALHLVFGFFLLCPRARGRPYILDAPVGQGRSKTPCFFSNSQEDKAAGGSVPLQACGVFSVARIRHL